MNFSINHQTARDHQYSLAAGGCSSMIGRPPAYKTSTNKVSAQAAFSLRGVLDIICETEDLLDAPSSYFDDLEPTPIGPNAVLSPEPDPMVPSIVNNMLNKRKSDSLCEEEAPCSATFFLFPREHEEEPVELDQVFSLDVDCHHAFAGAFHQQKKRRLVENSSWSGESNVDDDQEQEDEGQNSSASTTIFRTYQEDQWNDRFQELLDFKDVTGHCLVPHEFPANQKLAQWVKRQRYQYKLKQAGRHSTLTDARQQQLDSFGFVWDSHQAAWDEHFQTLKAFRALYGHCCVPSHYQEDRALAVWIKCQRRQMKLRLKGQKNSLNQSRIALMNSLGFEWNPRNL